MYEIELKAHVDDKKSVIEKLDSFAKFLKTVQKDDVYWGIYKDDKKIQSRIRTELEFSTDSKINKKTIYLTYKKKENRLDESGKSYEVNAEKECEISDESVLESFFQDLGLQILLKKQKLVSSWQYGECHIELCNVPPLGDFLEIEIISENNDSKTVDEKRDKLLEVLKKCEIDNSKIENRYYSELLKEYK